jgi:hypothetical protein
MFTLHSVSRANHEAHKGHDALADQTTHFMFFMTFMVQFSG